MFSTANTLFLFPRPLSNPSTPGPGYCNLYCTPPFCLLCFISNFTEFAEIFIFLSSYNHWVIVLLSDTDLQKFFFVVVVVKAHWDIGLLSSEEDMEHFNADITLAYLGKLSIWGLMLSGRVYYYVHCCLSRDGRTQANRQHFEKLGLDLWIHVQHLHVASTEAAPKYRQEYRKDNKRLASVWHIMQIHSRRV